MSSLKDDQAEKLKNHNPPRPTNEDEPSLGEQQPEAPFSLMTFTYPLLLILAMFLLGFIFWMFQSVPS